MGEISEKERELRRKHKDPDDIKVIFRCDATRKARLDILVGALGTDMSEFCRSFIDLAWKEFQEKK
jgi:hypothetical protein